MIAERISSHEVKIGNRTLTFTQSVYTILETDGVVVLELLTDDFQAGDDNVGRNVLGYDNQGNRLWIVEDHELKIGRKGKKVPQSFLGIYISQDGRKLKGVTPSVIFTIDPKTGKLSEPELNR